MASNNTGNGDTLNWTATFAATAGQIIVLASGQIGIALEDIASGATGPVALTETWTVNKSAATAGALGASFRTQSVGSTAPTVSLTTAGTSVVNAKLYAATTTAETTCKIRLNGL